MSPTPKEERSAGKATGGVEEIKCGPLNRFGSNKESDPMGTSSVDDQMASCSLAQPNIKDKFLSPTKRTHVSRFYYFRKSSEKPKKQNNVFFSEIRNPNNFIRKNAVCFSRKPNQSLFFFRQLCSFCFVFYGKSLLNRT